MAQEFLCDGCSVKVADGEVQQVGRAQKGDYCVTCAGEAANLYGELDGLQESLHAQWQQGLGDILRVFKTDHPGFDVPDFPER